jgi:LCP family protein required for cell wall assembly
MAVIVRTYLLARPRSLGAGRKVVGVAAVTALCLLVAAPLGYGANLANSQRNLLNDLFAGGGGTAAAEAITKPKLNILLVGSDAGPDRTGARTDTMMVANIDTRSGRTVLFALPRNIGRAQFPPGSPMAEEFPRGFHDSSDPTSGDYLLNAVYAYGQQHPELAPNRPTADPGLNLLHQTVSQMLGLQLDYFVEVNMAGFASIIDALGGLTVDVGPERIPIGGITPSGRQVRPDGYIEPGIQQLSGEQALAFARSRTGSTDYARMGRQRCLLQNILTQKSPTDLLANFQGVAAATTNSVATNIPQAVLPALAALAGNPGGISLESVSFDPNLPDPSEGDGFFNTGDPNFPYMREVVQDAINRPPPPPPPTTAPSTTRVDDRGAESEEVDEEEDEQEPASTAPTSLAQSCG